MLSFIRLMSLSSAAPRRALLVAATALLGAACRDVTVPLQDPQQVSYATTLPVRINLSSGWTRTASGLYYQDAVVGTGAVADSGSTVAARYTGWLADGRQFDTNQGARVPFSFVLGSGQVIKGWDEGIRGMRVGSRRYLVVPPSLGYGARTEGAIPAGSVLVFQIDLISVTPPAPKTGS